MSFFPDQQSSLSLLTVPERTKFSETRYTLNTDDNLHTEKILTLSDNFFIPNKMVPLKFHLLLGVKEKKYFFVFT